MLSRAGLCRSCAINPVALGSRRCTNCLEKERERSLERYRELHPNANRVPREPKNRPAPPPKPVPREKLATPQPQPAADTTEDLIPNPDIPPGARVIAEFHCPLFPLPNYCTFVDQPLPPEIANAIANRHTTPPDTDPETPEAYRGTGLELHGPALAEYRRIRAMHAAGIFDVTSPEAEAFKI